MITVVIPFCAGDSKLALNLLGWIEELGGCPNNPCLLVAAANVPEKVCEEMLGKVTSMFKAADIIGPKVSLPDERHPIGPNLMFQTACLHFWKKNRDASFLWLEPDCVPMRKGWLQTIESEMGTRKQILACVIELREPQWPAQIPSGVAVYPGDAWKHYGKLISNKRVAWDVQFANETIHHTARSATIYSRMNRDNPPTYVVSKGRRTRPNEVELSTVQQYALVHPCKDGSLIPLLRNGKPQFEMPEFIDHDPLAPSAPDVEYDGKPWRIEDYMHTVPIIRVPKEPHQKTTRANRIIHVVQRWRPKDPETDRRVHTALLSWIKLYDTGEVHPCHIWHPFKRDARSVGDDREIPFLRDLLLDALQLCYLDDDVVLLTNDDSVLHPDLGNKIFERLREQPCICTGRLNYKKGDQPDFINRTFPEKSIDIGRDAFAFRAAWLKRSMDKIPDMLMCEAQFDLVLGSLIRHTNRIKPTLDGRLIATTKCELPYGWVQHEEHERKWNLDPSLARPGQIYNLKLAAQWYRANKFDQMIDFAHHE